jgi:hypothetical protein
MLGTATTFCILTASAAAASIDKIEPAVREKIQASGTLRVLIDLHVERPNDLRIQREKQLYFERIKAAQESLLAELAGTPYRVVRQFEIVPAMSMWIGQEALEILERSSLVRRVHEPIKLRPLR